MIPSATAGERARERLSQIPGASRNRQCVLTAAAAGERASRFQTPGASCYSDRAY